MTVARATASDTISVGTFACLSLGFEVAAHPDLAEPVSRLYHACAVDPRVTAPSVRLEIRAEGGEWSASLDGVPAVRAVGRGDALVAAMRLVDGATVAASSRDALLVHASAVAGSAGPVLLVGPSGAGKSTLATALCARGHAYLGDEALGIDAGATGLRANPKPLKLDARSRALLFGEHDPAQTAAGAPFDEALVPPGAVGPVGGVTTVDAPSAVVEVAYRPGCGTRWSARSRADTAEAVADQCFNFAQWGARGLDTVAALARGARGFRLDFDDLDAAVGALEAVLA